MHLWSYVKISPFWHVEHVVKTFRYELPQERLRRHHRKRRRARACHRRPVRELQRQPLYLLLRITQLFLQLQNLQVIGFLYFISYKNIIIFRNKLINTSFSSYKRPRGGSCMCSSTKQGPAKPPETKVYGGIVIGRGASRCPVFFFNWFIIFAIFLASNHGTQYS